MKIGFCAKPDQAVLVAAAGFDYIEPPVNYIAGLTEEAFSACLEDLRASSVPAPSFNLLFPKTMQLLADDTTDEQVAVYLHGALSRVQRMGGKIAVFGSGKSRNRPADMSYDSAFRRLVRLTRMTGEIAVQYDVTIVIEQDTDGDVDVTFLDPTAAYINA